MSILDYTKDDVVEMPEVLTAEITAVEVMSSTEAFGDKAKSDKDVIKIYVTNKDLDLTTDVYVQYYEKGKVHPKSKLGKFINKYGSLDIGTKVKLVLNGDYYEVLL